MTYDRSDPNNLGSLLDFPSPLLEKKKRCLSINSTHTSQCMLLKKIKLFFNKIVQFLALSMTFF